jgi:hypothetical protein
VYRGVNDHSAIYGLSWTLDPERAAWFARRFFNERPIVVRATVMRHRIIAVFQEHREAEVLVFPRYVYNRSFQRPDPAPSESA